MVLNLPSASDIDFKTISDSEIESYLEKYNFVKQATLEDILLNLKIKSKVTITSLSDFRGQLERGTENARPHWQLYLSTVKQTVAKELVTSLSTVLYSVDLDFSIQVTTIRDVESTIEYVTKEDRLTFPKNSPWSPGTPSMIETNFRKELSEDPVLQDIFNSNARIYQQYLLNIINGNPNDRLIYWGMDFAGKTGKSKFTRAWEKAGKSISASIDHPRPFVKDIILNAQNYFARYGVDPQTVIIDLSRQVPKEYLSGFYGVLESLKNGKLTSMFQSMSKYEWKHPPHVIVFANMPPQSNALSANRMVLLEILNEDYDYAIRHATCETKLLSRTSKHVAY